MNARKTFRFGDHRFVFDSQKLALSVKSDDIRDTLGGGAEIASPLPLPASAPVHGNVRTTRGTTSAVATPGPPADGRLERLTLNVTNVCNMACRYCYAHGGRYYTAGILMSQDTALSAINRITRWFKAVDQVSFFGGEPSINSGVVQMACAYFSYLHRRGIIAQVPVFGLTTNAYQLEPAIFETMRTHRFTVTVSLDGPREVHDRLRRTIDGVGTYDAVVANVAKIAELGIVPEFECTYTLEHYRSGIRITDLMDFFYDTFGAHILHCPIVIARPGDPLDVPLEVAGSLQDEAIQYSVRNLARGIAKSTSVAARLVDSLAAKTPIADYCPAGNSLLTINADGRVYTCFMLMEREGFCIGEISELEPQPKRTGAIATLLGDADKQQNPECRQCWARPLCFGCIGEDIVRGVGIGERSHITGRSQTCDARRSQIETLLGTVAEIYLEEHPQAVQTSGPFRQ
jgi:uncharacterized protein